MNNLKNINSIYKKAYTVKNDCNFTNSSCEITALEFCNITSCNVGTTHLQVKNHSNFVNLPNLMSVF